MSLFYIILYFIVWCLVFIFSFKKMKTLNSYTTIVLSYTLYALLSIFCYGLGHFNDITLFPFIYLFLMLVIALRPIKQYEESKVCECRGVDSRIMYAVFFVFIIASIIVLPIALSNLQEGITVMFASEDGAAELYKEMHENAELGANAKGGIVGLCKIIRYLLFEIAVFFFFYYLVLSSKKNKALVSFLLFCFIVDVIISLADGNRTRSTMSMFTVLITMLIFYRFMKESLRKIVKIIGVIFVSIFLFFTLAVTISRSLTREGGTVEGIIEYVGQANLYFNEYALKQDGLRYGDRTCNYFKNMLGFDNVPKSIRQIRYKYPGLKLNDHNFSTFVGDFVIDFGPIVTTISFIIFSFIFCRITKSRQGIIRLDQLLFVQLSADICMHGGMYLFYYSFSGNYILLMYVIFAIILRFNSREIVIKVNR